MTTFSRIAARPLAATIRFGGNPAARAINRASWLAGKVGSCLTPNRYYVGATRREITEILKQQKFTVTWTIRDPQNASNWNELRPDIVYDEGMRLYPGPLGCCIKGFKTGGALKNAGENINLKQLAKRLPAEKAKDVVVMGKYLDILTAFELKYSDKLYLLIDRLPQATLEDIGMFRKYCELINFFECQKGFYASCFDLIIHDLFRKLPQEILADIDKFSQILKFAINAPRRGWESEQIDLLINSIISFTIILPPDSLKSGKLAEFFTCRDDLEFRTLSDNLMCLHVLANEFRTLLVPGEEYLDGSVLRKVLLDMIGRLPLGKNNLERMLLIPPRLLIEAGRLEKAMELVKEVGIDPVTETFSKVFPHGLKIPKEINFEVYYILMIASSKLPAGKKLEGYTDAVLDTLDDAGKKRYEKDLSGLMIHFMRDLVKMIDLLPDASLADISIFRKYMDFWLDKYGLYVEDMTAHDYYLESFAHLRNIKDCLPKKISASEESIRPYQEALYDACENVERSAGSTRTSLGFMRSVSVLLKGLSPEAFEPEKFARFFRCKSDAEIRALMDIMICYRVLAEDYEKKISIGPEEFDRAVIREKLLAAVKGINLDFSLEGLWNIPIAFLMESGLMERLRKIVKNTIPDFPDNVQHYTEAGLVSSLIKLRENWLWGTRMGSEDNILHLLDIVNKYGTIDAYYRKEKAKILAQLSEAGFNIDHLLGGAEVLNRDISGNEDPKEKTALLPERFRDLMRRIVGTKGSTPGSAPEKYFKFNRDARKLFHEIGLRAALQGDSAAIERAATALLKMIEEERKDNRDRVLEDWHDRLSGILGELAYKDMAVTIRRMRAVRSRKYFPEILFDNQRLGCCIFWPNGEERHEIPLIVLDPKTPLLEIWLEGSDESMGVACQILGTNSGGKPVVFVDTFEGSHYIYDNMGRNHSLRFMLDALVVDAHRMGARELVIHKCTYGKPAEFVNFVKDQATKSGGSITEAGKYQFTAVDAEDEALSDSKLGKHHYTDAFGLNNNLKGEKPCLVIDVAAYLKRALDKKSAVQQHRFEIMRNLDEKTITEMVAIETEAFPEILRYGSEYFKALSRNINFHVVSVRNEQGEMVGFALGYTFKSDPKTMYLDDMALNNKGRGKGLGKASIERLEQAAIGLGCTRMTLHCREQDVDGRKLVKYYESVGFELVAGSPSGGFMEKDLRK